MKIAHKQQLENNAKAINDLEARVKRLEDMMSGAQNKKEPPANTGDYEGDIEPSKEKTVAPVKPKKKTSKKASSKKASSKPKGQSDDQS